LHKIKVYNITEEIIFCRKGLNDYYVYEDRQLNIVQNYEQNNNVFLTARRKPGRLMETQLSGQFRH
jgi:hypothetical protein